MIGQDALIGSIRNYGWPEIKTFVNSVERCGYSGDKIMFVENVEITAMERLHNLGWTLVHVIADPSQNYGTGRHIPVLEFLRDNPYNYVIYCDVRDLVFQSDPAAWLKEHLAPHELIGASECLRIRDEGTNQSWIVGGLGQAVLNTLWDQDILCAGTIAGTWRAVVDLLTAICQLSRDFSGWGFDQAYVNYLLREPYFKDMTRIAKMEEGFIATCSWFLSGPERFTDKYTDEVPIFDTVTNVVRAPETHAPFAIVHQYDRGGGWEWRMAERFK